MTNLALSYFAGIVMVLSPCILPVLPMLIGGAGPRGAIALSVGMVFSFTAAGVAFGYFASALPFTQDDLRLAGALLLLVAGLTMLLPSQWTARALAPLTALSSKALNWEGRWRFGGSLRSVALGALMGIVWAPCAGPVLGAVAGSGLASGNAAFVFFFFSLGSATVLVLAGHLAKSRFQNFKQRALHHGVWIQKGFGATLLLSGLLIVTGADQVIQGWVFDSLPGFWVEFLGSLSL